jgi:hypothetical protein
LGGEGVGYHDLDSANKGGQYRPGEGVDIEPTGGTGEGCNIGWMQAGEWLRYTVNVAAEGTYDVAMRVASSGNGGTFHIEFDGVDKTGPIPVPNTGGWQVWQTVTVSGIGLKAGQQVMRIVLDANASPGSVGNINSMTFSTSSAMSSPPTNPEVRKRRAGLAKGLVGHWEMEDESGTMVFDSSGFQNEGAISGGATWIPAASGQILNLDGVDGAMTVPDAKELAVGNTAHTVAAWVNMIRLPSDRAWIMLLGLEQPGSHHWLIDASGTMQLGAWNGAGLEAFLPVGQWCHIAVTFDGLTLRRCKKIGHVPCLAYQEGSPSENLECARLC